MSGHGRTLHVTQNWPPIDETVWVPLIRLPWRPDELDRIKPDIEERAS